MKTIAYSSPFVPAEWIAAHGLRPQWLRLRMSSGRPQIAVTRGICPYAGALIDAALSGIDAASLVLTTACDQMRYAAAVIESRGKCPIFLLNIPSTWQRAEVRKLYVDELKRLGRFLVQFGGKSPDNADLTQVMLAYDRARLAVHSARNNLSAREFAEAIAAVRGPLPNISVSGPDIGTSQTDGIPLAVLGGPLLEPDYTFFNLIEQAGGRVVLDATEGGERTMPRPFDPAKVLSDPLHELADAYFDYIPDAFLRPNNRLYEWLGCELAARQVRGIVFRRYVWCDLWHAELHRLKEWSPVPVLDIDAGSDDSIAPNRVQGRIEAFMEMLR
jgi:benzoyl-CoA reductase/2-hydroxyglutaryl-CoA dehydratase subunit BcrC/BadD/HgdB